MFEKLKQRWGVKGLQLLLIIITFALGGSLCAYAGKKLMVWMNLDRSTLWGVIIYIVLVTLIWPLCVLLVSIPLGQFTFFKKYIRKIFTRWSKKTSPENNTRQSTINIAIFASGAGSNAQQLINHFSRSSHIKIALIVCNKPGAGVLDIAARENIPSLLIERERFLRGDNYLPELHQYAIHFIVLAGFLWKIPEPLIQAYPKKIVNIHPALLPDYGGKGMFGHHVHEAVINNKDSSSGITIHYVDELYDHGAIIFQASCTVDANDSPEDLAKKIHVLEHTHYPTVIAGLLNDDGRQTTNH